MSAAVCRMAVTQISLHRIARLTRRTTAHLRCQCTWAQWRRNQVTLYSSSIMTAQNRQWIVAAYSTISMETAAPILQASITRVDWRARNRPSTATRTSALRSPTLVNLIHSLTRGTQWSTTRRKKESPARQHHSCRPAWMTRVKFRSWAPVTWGQRTSQQPSRRRNPYVRQRNLRSADVGTLTDLQPYTSCWKRTPWKACYERRLHTMMTKGKA